MDACPCVPPRRRLTRHRNLKRAAVRPPRARANIAPRSAGALRSTAQLRSVCQASRICLATVRPCPALPTPPQLLAYFICGFCIPASHSPWFADSPTALFSHADEALSLTPPRAAATANDKQQDGPHDAGWGCLRWSQHCMVSVQPIWLCPQEQGPVAGFCPTDGARSDSAAPAQQAWQPLLPPAKLLACSRW